MTAEPHSPPKDRDGTTTGWIVGAYAAAPSRAGWNPADEASFYNALADLPGVVGFEVPFADTLHKVDEDWLLAQLSSDVDIVVTTAPGTSAACVHLPGMGWHRPGPGPSKRPAHRGDACSRPSPERCSRPASRARCRDYSASSHIDGVSSSDQLHHSLEQIASLGLGGARLVIEHCDSALPGHKPLKAIFRWKTRSELSSQRSERQHRGRRPDEHQLGRSVIEMRDADAGRVHATGAWLLVRSLGHPASPIGGAWADVHAPVATSAAVGDERSALPPRADFPADSRTGHSDPSRGWCTRCAATTGA